MFNPALPNIRESHHIVSYEMMRSAGILQNQENGNKSHRCVPQMFVGRKCVMSQENVCTRDFDFNCFFFLILCASNQSQTVFSCFICPGGRADLGSCHNFI